MCRRNNIEIIADMLRPKSQSKTQLYMSSGLSHRLFRSYVAFLVCRGFLRESRSNGSRVFETTESGLELVTDIDGLMERIGRCCGK